MTSEKLLSNRYRFKEDYMPYQLMQSQREARREFLDELYKKEKFITINKCPYCRGINFTKISEVDSRGLPSDIVICNSCNGCFKSAILDHEANRYYYQKISYALRGKELSENAIEKLFVERIKLFACPLYYFARHFLELRPERDFIVEFGCGDGANLVPWQKNGFSVLGIELDLKMVEFGQKKGLNLIMGDLLSYSSEGKKPKLIILSHLLEHVIDVNAALSKLFELLESDGYLFIEVPGLKAQTLRNPLGNFDVEHNYYFELKSLRRLIEGHSFKILYADEYIRLLCTPLQNKSTSINRKIPLSLDRLKANLVKAVIDIINFKDANLYKLLRLSETGSFKIRILHKLEMMYFQYYYSSLTRRSEANAAL